MTTINTIDDFLKILDDHPAWLDAVRVRIIGHELLQLPSQVNALNKRFDAFVEYVAAFIQRQEAFNEYVAAFIQRQEEFITEQRQFNDNANARMNRIESDIAIVKGGHARVRLKELLPTFLDDMECDLIESPTLLELSKMSKQIPDATPGQRRSFSRADLIALVKDRATGETFYLAAEISWTADQRDTDRAQRNARYLTQITGLPALPAISSIRNTHEVETLLESGAVRWFQLDEHDLAAD